MDATGKVALVTGGARRVGRALALGLAEAGADVVIHYNRSRSEADGAVQAVEAMGRRAVAVGADLEDASSPGTLIDEVRQRFGRLDILVNNASLFESADFEAIEAEDWDRVMAVNLRAPFLLTRAAAPLLREDSGLVVNIADLSGIQAWTRFAHHGISKAGLIHLTRVAARALAPEIRVNCIVPGTVLPPEDYTDEQVERSVQKAALKRTGSPDDVLEALLFLVRSGFATGSVVTVDGGRMLT